MDDSNKILNDSELYSEAGEHYRFFLTWRNATVAAIIAVAYFGLSFFSDQLEGPKALSILILIGTSLVVVILWITEIRTRDLYRTAQKVGIQLEEKAKKTGINTGYSKTPSRYQVWKSKEYNSIDFEPEKITINWWKHAIYNGFSHSFAINTLCTLVLVGLATTIGLRVFNIIEVKEEPKKVDKQAEILELQKWNNEKLSELMSKIILIEEQAAAIRSLENIVDSLSESMKNMKSDPSPDFNTNKNK